MSKLMQKLSQKLFAEAEQQSQFLNALQSPQPYPDCILWCQPRPAPLPFKTADKLSWQPPFVDRLSPDQRPGQHPLHDAGHYYCLDFSSVFAASILLNLPTQPTIIFDVCAAPGGKSIFAWQLFQPEHLIANETISKRVGRLIGNFKRCQIQPAIVLSTDPSHLAQHLAQTADLVIIDAPCSGQSLLAKGGSAPGCFHPVTIRQNAQRQKRILAHAAQLVAPGGYLAYMTCTFAPEENERVGRWFLQKFPQFQAQRVLYLESYQSHLADFPCYRIWPQSGLGAGAFSLLLWNTQRGDRAPLPTDLWPGWRWAG